MPDIGWGVEVEVVKEEEGQRGRQWWIFHTTAFVPSVYWGVSVCVFKGDGGGFSQQ